MDARLIATGAPLKNRHWSRNADPFFSMLLAMVAPGLSKRFQSSAVIGEPALLVTLFLDAIMRTPVLEG